MSENPNFISNKFSKERNEEDIRWCRKIFQRGSVFASSRFVIRVRSDEKKKRKKELFKSRTTLVQRERERERGKKITQHKAEKWISSRSFKFLFFFFPSREFAICLLSFTKKNVSDRFTKYEISAIFLSTEKMNFCTAVNEEIKWNYGGGYLWRRKYGE